MQHIRCIFGKIQIIYSYEFSLKALPKAVNFNPSNLTSQYSEKLTLKNKTLMFLRSPKHFKTGKQKLRYAKYAIKCTHTLTSSSLMLIKYTKMRRLFNIINSSVYVLHMQNTNLGRISLKTPVTILFI